MSSSLTKLSVASSTPNTPAKDVSINNVEKHIAESLKNEVVANAQWTLVRDEYSKVYLTHQNAYQAYLDFLRLNEKNDLTDEINKEQTILKDKADQANALRITKLSELKRAKSFLTKVKEANIQAITPTSKTLLSKTMWI